MRRRLHIAIALLTFACGFVLAGAARSLPYALPAALALPLLSKLLLKFGRDPHRLKAAALTLVLWTIPLVLVARLLGPTSGDELVASEAGAHDAPRVDDEPDAAPPAYEEAVADEEAFEAVCVSGASFPARAWTHTLWAGVIDRKALSKPPPAYPLAASDERASGTAAVWVVVDVTGRVVGARPIAGHPLLRREAARAACAARFSPLLVNGPPVWVSGVLTYRFER